MILLISWYREEYRILKAEGRICNKTAQTFIGNAESLAFLATGTRWGTACINLIECTTSSLHFFSTGWVLAISGRVICSICTALKVFHILVGKRLCPEACNQTGIRRCRLLSHKLINQLMIDRVKERFVHLSFILLSTLPLVRALPMCFFVSLILFYSCPVLWRNWETRR